MLRLRQLSLVAFLALTVSVAAAADRNLYQIMTVRPVPSDSTAARLIVIDGGYADGLELGQIATLTMSPDSGADIATLEIFDIDRSEAYCLALLLPDADPAALDRRLAVDHWVDLPPPADTPEELQQKAIQAMGSGDYRTAAARLTRMLEADPENGSLRSALKRAEGKLQKADGVPLDADRLRIEQARLPLYNAILPWYFRKARYERVAELANRILAIDSTNSQARTYLDLASSQRMTNLASSVSTGGQFSGPPPIGADDSDHVFVNWERTYQRAARYPADASREGVGGRVWIMVDIDTTGSVLRSVIAKSSGDLRLDNAARAASWFARFKPCTDANGHAIAASVIYNIDFVPDKK